MSRPPKRQHEAAPARFAVSRLLVSLLLVVVFPATGLAAAHGGDWKPNFPNPGENSYVGNSPNGIGGYDVQVDVANAGNALSTFDRVYGGYNDGTDPNQLDANNNRVIINDPDNPRLVLERVYGGYSVSGNANGNTVTFNAKQPNVATVYGGYSAAGKADGNTVTINYGEIVDITGGYGKTGASGNTVIIAGLFTGSGANPGNVVGGMADEGSATGNTVVLAPGEPTSFALNLYGGYGTADDPFTGNTLEVWSKGISVRSVQNFENYHFILPANIQAGDTMLTINGGEATRFKSKFNVGVAVAAGTQSLKAGDSVTLIRNAAGLRNSAGGELAQGTDYRQVSLNGATLKGRQGISLEYDFTLSNTGTTLDATVAPPEESTPADAPASTGVPAAGSGAGSGVSAAVIRQETKAVLEHVAAVAASLNNAGDLASTTIGQIYYAAQKSAPDGKTAASGNASASGEVTAGSGGVTAGEVTASGKAEAGSGEATAASGKAEAAPVATTGSASSTFGGTFIGRQRFKTGSHVDVGGFSGLAGLSKRARFGRAEFLAGAFFEVGAASMDTHNSFPSGDVDGSGHSSYVGGGVLARLGLARGALSGAYAEGSLRAGGMNSDWRSEDLRDAATGRRAEYDLNTPYVGAHAGLGWVLPLADNLDADLYGKYFWTHLRGDDALVAFDRYDFDDADSSRLRVGTRLDWRFGARASLHVGAAWEREFAGEINAVTYGLEPPSPSMEGDSGLFDLGLTFAPASVPNLGLGLGVTGYAGKRRGVSGNVMLQYTF